MLDTRCVLFWFAAFFPPANDEDDVDYYEVLGVSGNASKEEIRKAYKKKSLALHPDKIQQRGGNPSDLEYRMEFQVVQEAHAVLSDDKKRKRYDLVNRSSTRYKFLTDDGAVTAAYENLGKSTCGQKSRLVLLLAIVLAAALLQPILVCVKINQILDPNGGGALENTPWIVLLIPWWIGCFLYLVLILGATFIMGCGVMGLVGCMEAVSWVVGQVILALRWDLTVSADYAMVFVPFYIALAFRGLGMLLTMRQMQNDVRHMITVEKLEQVLDKPYRDLSEQEQDELGKQFIIVHLPPDAQATGLDGDDVVQLSPEYQGAMQVYFSSVLELFNLIVFAVPFVVLLVLKLDANLDASWWTVFAPIWAYLGVQLLSNCYSCCCTTVGDEIIIIAPDASEEGDEAQESTDPDHTSSDFVHASSSINQFNKSATGSNETKASVKSSNAANKTSSSAAVPSSSTTTPPTTNEPEIVVEETNMSDDYPEMDEEAYHNFQQAYQQAEANASEKQSKAAGRVCTLLYQLMIVCLVVGKLQQDVPSDDNVGYNALWIIFPILFVTGCVLCCWGCLIYCAGMASLDELVKRAAAEKAAEDDDGRKDDEEMPVVVPEPPPPVALSTPPTEPAPLPTTTTTCTTTTTTIQEVVPAGFDSDDLD